MDPFYILLSAWLVSVMVIVISIAWAVEECRASADEDRFICDRQGGWEPKHLLESKGVLVSVAVTESALMILVPMLVYALRGSDHKTLYTLVAYSVGVLAILMFSYWKKTRVPKWTFQDFDFLYRAQLNGLVVQVSIAVYILAILWFVYSSMR